MLEKPNIYLDIDGVLRGNRSPAEDIISFVRYILDNFPGQIYWLTTHCNHGVNNTLPALKDAFPVELAEELFDNVYPTDWRELKTSGIDLSHDFIWFDDNLFVSEQYALDEKGLRYNAYTFNPHDPHAARNALTFLKSCPVGDSAPLRRFLSATLGDFELARAEISSGQKRGHYMWYMFPQIHGLGQSENSKYYAIRDELEAVEFLNHDILSAQLLTLCDGLIKSEACIDAIDIFGELDALKLKSCMTLFDFVSKNNLPELTSNKDYSLFQKVLDKFFGGKPDAQTIQILESY